jgi:hypothetical protein
LELETGRPVVVADNFLPASKQMQLPLDEDGVDN